MSFESPQQQQAAEAARAQATRSQQLADISLPQLSSILGRVTGDLSATGISPSVMAAYDTARTGINQDFATAGRGQQAYIQQAFAQGGNLYNTNQIDDAKKTAALNLDQARQGALQNLSFQEAESGLTQFNALMNLLSGGAGTALNLAGGFAGQQSQAIGMLSNQSPGQGALGGALAGAGTGATFGPWGSVIGGVLGGIGGYYGSGG